MNYPLEKVWRDQKGYLRIDSSLGPNKLIIIFAVRVLHHYSRDKEPREYILQNVFL